MDKSQGIHEIDSGVQAATLREQHNDMVLAVSMRIADVPSRIAQSSIVQKCMNAAPGRRSGWLVGAGLAFVGMKYLQYGDSPVSAAELTDLVQNPSLVPTTGININSDSASEFFAQVQDATTVDSSLPVEDDMSMGRAKLERLMAVDFDATQNVSASTSETTATGGIAANSKGLGDFFGEVQDSVEADTDSENSSPLSFITSPLEDSIAKLQEHTADLSESSDQTASPSPSTSESVSTTALPVEDDMSMGKAKLERLMAEDFDTTQNSSTSSGEATSTSGIAANSEGLGDFFGEVQDLSGSNTVSGETASTDYNTALQEAVANLSEPTDQAASPSPTTPESVSTTALPVDDDMSMGRAKLERLMAEDFDTVVPQVVEDDLNLSKMRLENILSDIADQASDANTDQAAPKSLGADMIQNLENAEFNYDADSDTLSSSLQKGETIWGDVGNYIEAVAKEKPSDAQVDIVKDWVLEKNGISEAQAQALPVGFQFRIPNPDELKDLLGELED